MDTYSAYYHLANVTHFHRFDPDLMKTIASLFAYSSAKYIASFKLCREPSLLKLFEDEDIQLRQIICISNLQKHGSQENNTLRVYERLSPPKLRKPRGDGKKVCVEADIKKFWNVGKKLVEQEYHKYNEKLLKSLPSGTRNKPR